jgi:hypothetical protein
MAAIVDSGTALESILQYPPLLKKFYAYFLDSSTSRWQAMLNNDPPCVGFSTDVIVSTHLSNHLTKPKAAFPRLVYLTNTKIILHCYKKPRA